MQPSSPAALLNEPQRRHLAVTLSQIQRLIRETSALLDRPVTRDGMVTEADDLPAPFREAAAAAIAGLDREITDLGLRFDLPRRERSRFRWVRAVLGNSIDNLEDARAARLGRYGPVDPALQAALDPALRDLQQRLRGLLDVLERTGP